MLLETLPIQQQVNENITEVIANSASSAIKPILSEIWKIAFPIIEILGGILVLYLIYRIISSISDHLLKKRVKRIDQNVHDLNNKVNEILNLLKKKSEQKSKKEKKSK